jgi:hypothetical protein
MMKIVLFTLAAVGLIGGVYGQDAKQGEAGALAARSEAGGSDAVDVVKTLTDLLIVADGEEVKEAELEEGKDFYLVYHSASW